MKMRKLGRTGLSVSEICLGSMTWGSQNTEAEGHQQLDYAFDQGVNFIDTAEMYPTTPFSPDTVGGTEEIIGSWIGKRGRRDEAIIATKVVGPGGHGIDNGAPITPEKIRNACDRSLKRLQTDYIDLYQIHWPNRGSYHFGQHWEYSPDRQDRQHALDDIEAVLETFEALIKEGKVRHLGLSNETTWGTAKYLEMATKRGLPRVASVQNEYSLLKRLFDVDFAELAHHEEVGLLVYTSLAAGLLTGKYEDGNIPAGSRRSINPSLFGRVNPRTENALAAYLSIARKHDLNPAQMAIGWCLARPFVTSVIIGATSMDQLKVCIDAKNIALSEAILADIAEAHRNHPAPY